MVAEQTLLRSVQGAIVAFFVLLLAVLVPSVTDALRGSSAVMFGYVLLLLACVLVAVGGLVLLNRS